MGSTLQATRLWKISRLSKENGMAGIVSYSQVQYKYETPLVYVSERERERCILYYGYSLIFGKFKICTQHSLSDILEFSILYPTFREDFKQIRKCSEHFKCSIRRRTSVDNATKQLIYSPTMWKSKCSTNLVQRELKSVFAFLVEFSTHKHRVGLKPSLSSGKNWKFNQIWHLLSFPDLSGGSWV